MAEKLAKINAAMSYLTNTVDDTDKRIKEFESKEDFEEVRGEIQSAMNSTRWHHSLYDIKRWLNPINTWDELKK